MKCDKKDLLLYAVTDRSWLNAETLYSQVEKALEGGATFVQLREKHLDHDAFLQEAKEIKELCAKYRYRLCWMMMWSLHWKLARTEFM